MSRILSFGLAIWLGTCLQSSAAPLVSGHVDGFNNRFNWLVYSDLAPDNPHPKMNEFTYVYWQEAIGGAIPIYSVELLDRTAGNPIPDLGELTTTDFIAGTGAEPTVVGPGFWRWNEFAGVTLQPGNRTASLFVNSPDAPGEIQAAVYNCNPLVCFIATTEIVGPVAAPVPEPATLVKLAVATVCLGIARFRTRRA